MGSDRSARSTSRSADKDNKGPRPEWAIYGLMIVRGPGSGPESPLPPWHSYREALRSQATLDTSLPRREPEERRAITDAFLGVTTWQRVCRFGLPWPPATA